MQRAFHNSSSASAQNLLKEQIMKKLHQENLFCWSVFNEERNIDFHSYLWVRAEGNVAIDPLPLSEHDQKHLQSLGPLAHIVITNSDHIRNSQNLAQQTGAKIWAPLGEKESFPFVADHWLGDEESIVPGLIAFSLNGSKTPGELAFLLEEKTLITGDLIRAHEGGRLCLLPEPKLSDQAAALESLQRLAKLTRIEAVLPGDGWPVFREGHTILNALWESYE